jgi:hypothetical protein
VEEEEKEVKMNYYLLLARGGVEPEIIGDALDSWEAVQIKAIRLTAEGVIHKVDGVFWLLVQDDMRPEVRAFSADEFDTDMIGKEVASWRH